MKKLMSIVFSVALILGIASTASAEENRDVQRALELIEKTNMEIEKKIAKGVEEADEIRVDYLEDVRKIEEGKEIRKINEEKEIVLSELAKVENDEKKKEKLNEKLAKLEIKLVEETERLNAKLLKISQELDELTALLLSAEGKDEKKIREKISKLEEKMNKREEMHQARTEKYVEDLDKVIGKVYDETLEMSNETIKKVAEYGVTAECSWQLVRFGDKEVWIDPVRVVGL
ncbi:hypothetical protein V7654_18925 [Bacillus sp. JJ1609]|uniref:hypothetical protein n=1 Tax=Bacillus sp. JJ1609 TaxID=3122977 RepID=UPI002FFE05E5